MKQGNYENVSFLRHLLLVLSTMVSRQGLLLKCKNVCNLKFYCLKYLRRESREDQRFASSSSFSPERISGWGKCHLMSKVKCQVSDNRKKRSREMSPVLSIIISTARPSRGWVRSGLRDRPGTRARRCSPSPRSSAIMSPGDNRLTWQTWHRAVFISIFSGYWRSCWWIMIRQSDPPAKVLIECCVMQYKSYPISVQARQMLKWASWSEAWDPYQILTWWVVME